ncbi:sorting nexin-32 isoform X3 [Parambassis ranga]|uniref:Sorting nexin-32 isoform X3 n=1 Tax=Parambassis ranga TaxID=210632 RepID=A0A6P7INR8_9TELE|nr:sorting nexin-32-like isoform X3 [Parambassis ranga]
MMEEAKDEASVLSVHGDDIKVTEVLKDGDTLTFLIISKKDRHKPVVSPVFQLSGTGEYHVDRTYDDFEWLQQHLFAQEDVPGIQGVIFPPLPAKPQVNASAKTMKQLGILGLGEWQPYCKAMETFLRQVAAHSVLCRNKAVEVFLTSSAPPGRQKIRKNIFNRLSQAVEEMRKEGHKKFLDMVLTEQKIAVACGHFSAALHLLVEPGEDADKQAFSRVCVKLSEVFESMKKNMTSVAENNMSTLGLGLDLESRHQEAEKEMLFRRTCKLVELESTKRNAEKAKPVKKLAMEEVKKAAETEFEHICRVAKQEITRFEKVRVEMLQQALVQWCEKQLLTAKESADQFNKHLQVFGGMA